jgi:hypothetical protein
VRSNVAQHRGLDARVFVAACGALLAFSSGCGSDSGGGAASSGGSGGALQEAGTVGQSGSGGSSGTGTLGPPSVQCQALVAHQVMICGQPAQEADLTSCVNATTLYAPEGCAAAWNAYVQCATTAQIDCTKGPIGCTTQKSGYSACNEQAVAATGCNRNTGQDGQCSGATPYAFFCSKLPSSCVPLPGGTATAACCAAFPTR